MASSSRQWPKEENGPDRPAKRPRLGTEDLFVSSKQAPFSRSQEPPRRLTRDLGAPTIALSSSAPAAIPTYTYCDGFEVPVIAPLGGDTGRSMSKSPDPVTGMPQEDAISVSDSFTVERLEAASSSSIGPASSPSQNSMVLQFTANTPQILVSTLSIFPSPTSGPGFWPQEGVQVTDGAKEAQEPLAIKSMDVLHERVALDRDLEGDSALPSAAEGSPGHTVVASAIASVAPSIEITLPMGQPKSVHVSPESPSAPCTRTKTMAFVEPQSSPASLGLGPTPCYSSKPLNSVHSMSTNQNRPKHGLASPFRSPLRSKRVRDENLPPSSSPTEGSPVADLGDTNKQPRGRFLLPPIPLKKPEFTLGSHTKNDSTRAAKSAFKPPTFKSPLRASPATPTSQTSIIYPSSSASVPSNKTASTPIWTPSDNRPATALTIQTLERRLAMLERAIKIRSVHEGEEALEGLTRKWKDVARDVSWELWAIVKQNHMGGVGGTANAGGEGCGLFTKPGDKNGSEGRFRSGWGWDDKDKGTHSTDWNAECGEEKRQREEDAEEEGEPENKLTMSVMLRQLGITESTLGWDEAEGDFKAD